MDLLALPIGSIIVYAAIAAPSVLPEGWKDITGTVECMRHIEDFRINFPKAGEFVAHDPLFCIKKVAQDAVS